MEIGSGIPVRRLRGRVVLPDGVRDGAVITFADGRIASVEEPRSGTAGLRDLADLPDHTIYPGWINVHVHGARGLDFADDDARAPGEIARYLATQGWTGFLATYLARPHAMLLDALSHLRRTIEMKGEDDARGASALGVHFEGPFLNPQKKGSHRREDLVDPSPAVLDAMLDAVPAGLKALVTLAAELPGADRLVERLHERGAIASLGHSQATHAQATGAIARGVKHAVHLFNASSPLGHREPGVPGAFLTTPGTTCEVIPDLVHLHPAILKLALAARPDGVVLVTDSIAPTGLGEGTHRWAGRDVHVSAGRATLDDGTVAGSVLETPRMLAILDELGVDPVLLARIASAHPARALGLTDRGSLEPGRVADVTVIGPDHRPALTLVAGRIAHVGGTS